MSEAHEGAGSQTGSQQRQMPGDARPRPAIIGAAKQHVRRHLATSGDVAEGASEAVGRRFESCSGRTARGAAKLAFFAAVFKVREPAGEPIASHTAADKVGPKQPDHYGSGVATMTIGAWSSGRL